MKDQINATTFGVQWDYWKQYRLVRVWTPSTFFYFDNKDKKGKYVSTTIFFLNYN